MWVGGMCQALMWVGAKFDEGGCPSLVWVGVKLRYGQVASRDVGN